MKKRLVIQGRLSDAQQTELSDLFEVDVLPKTSSLDAPENRALLAETHGIIGSGLAITPQLLDAAPNLKVIATISVGYDNIPVDELTKRGIMLCNTPDVLTETTADTGFALIMAAARRVVELAEWVKADKWQASIGPALFGSDVHGKTLGMVGFGRIGQAVARRGALGFGMQVLYSNASPKPDLESELGAQRRELNELLAEADFVCVTVPLTAETEHLIGAQEFALMKPSGIFINIARGKVVDESALIHALETSVIQAAGLDVFEQEPLRAASPLTKMPNVVALPHIGSATHETRDAMAQRAVDNIRLALQGERPISLVNEETYQ
ncbi:MULTISPECIES: 2-hydroxyacid dehydrogenase [Halomonadaceae]|uniref:Glyoxylate/hydroxypyruvate reductase B n=1 Tax=Vreelandella titanicae TaxID=664683 RepID=A0A6N0YSK0_9GAMM|nr:MULTISPECIES: D-glycerate dehydrogenase [Halomonas]MCE7519469.1 D-glycerate dehydrogenase [Halomonas titanicae]NVE92186.1 D-glycerate dehydrogenase [Halomonas titanicae]PKH59092.1 D-glycerate dehydrogenase [Halomonas sp. Choline-3u-9]QKS22900.1 Glyoxylate/hydroxypyruvate reductase B [Halomonas titanicae]CDG55915.1 2-oxo-carboxylic acid reductase (glyoxalate reductase) (2-ketoaldonate reductase) [Halomonas sp. A3H3]